MCVTVCVCSLLQMDEVMLQCLLEKNEQDRQLALEDAYNLQDACSRLAHETHVKTFSQILSGEVCVLRTPRELSHLQFLGCIILQLAAHCFLSFGHGAHVHTHAHTCMHTHAHACTHTQLDEAVYREWIRNQALLTEALRKKAEGKVQWPNTTDTHTHSRAHTHTHTHTHTHHVHI